ncbi:hypothetical protein ACJMK2_027771 [Sinanodonta woodiana]|uniref:RNA polymerase beta subunit n=1 Tax=Sinanodonta woodiana TaxID=1069815 RepID=A0ABD3X4Y7_SINWO
MIHDEINLDFAKANEKREFLKNIIIHEDLLKLIIPGNVKEINYDDYMIIIDRLKYLLYKKEFKGIFNRLPYEINFVDNKVFKVKVLDNVKVDFIKSDNTNEDKNCLRINEIKLDFDFV